MAKEIETFINKLAEAREEVESRPTDLAARVLYARKDKIKRSGKKIHAYWSHSFTAACALLSFYSYIEQGAIDRWEETGKCDNGQLIVKVSLK